MLFICGQIFPLQSPHSQAKPTFQPNIAIDTNFYTQLTDDLLTAFYPKFCCNEQLTQKDGKRDTVLRCPKCHKQQSSLSGTPLHHLKLPRWTFTYLLKESQLQYPKVLTSTEIMKRLGVSISTSIRLKRRLQLFATDLLPRMQEKFYTLNKLAYHQFKFPKDRNTDLTELVKDLPIPQADTVVLYSTTLSKMPQATIQPVRYTTPPPKAPTMDLHLPIEREPTTIPQSTHLHRNPETIGSLYLYID